MAAAGGRQGRGGRIVLQGLVWEDVMDVWDIMDVMYVIDVQDVAM